MYSSLYVKLNKSKTSFVARNIAMHSIFIVDYRYGMSIKINKATLSGEDSEDQLQWSSSFAKMINS